MAADAPEQPSANTDLLAAAQEAARLARDLAPETERARRLPAPLLEALRDPGLLRAGAPTKIGAAQVSPAVALACAETVARGDASAGWCVSIAITSSLLAAYLPAATAQELLGGPAAVAAGVWAPTGQARPVEGGFAVSGRWAFCSGIDHADVLFAGCISPEGGPPLIAALPITQLEVLDTWHVSGLRGTGSHDAVADDVIVPAEHTLSLADGPIVDAPLYRFPIFGLFALSIAAAALGNARGAIDDLVELAVAKRAGGSGRTLAERPATQAAVAEAEAALRAARALVDRAVDDAWTAAQHAEPVGEELRLGLRLAATHAVRTAADVTRTLYDLGGGTAIYEGSPLQRRFRDAHTATAHFQVNPATYELTGRLLLGLPTTTTQL